MENIPSHLWGTKTACHGTGCPELLILLETWSHCSKVIGKSNSTANPVPFLHRTEFSFQNKILRCAREGRMLHWTERSVQGERSPVPGHSVLWAAPVPGGSGLLSPWHALINLRCVIDSNERGWLAPRTNDRPELAAAPAALPARSARPGRTASLPFNLLLLPPQLIEISFILDVL